MSIVDWPPSSFPLMPEGTNTLAPTFNADQTIDAANEANGWSIRVPKTGTLHSVEFRTATIASFPVNGIRVSFQDLDSSGFPDNVQDQFRDITANPGASSWATPPGPMTSDGTDNGSKRSVTAGDYLGVVIENANFQSGDSFQIGQANWSGLADAGDEGQQGFLRRTSGSVWSLASGKAINLALRYTDGYVVLGNPRHYPFLTMPSQAFNSGSTPDERGLLFQVPMRLQIRAFWLRAVITQAADVVLYDANSNVVVSSTVSKLYNVGQHTIIPIAQTILDPGVNYRLVLKPTSGSNVTLYHFTVNSAGLLACCHGGTGCYYTQRTDAGAWTDTTTARPWMGVIVDGIELRMNNIFNRF